MTHFTAEHVALLRSPHLRNSGTHDGILSIRSAEDFAPLDHATIATRNISLMSSPTGHSITKREFPSVSSYLQASTTGKDPYHLP
jgi:hypothetical protein